MNISPPDVLLGLMISQVAPQKSPLSGKTYAGVPAVVAALTSTHVGLLDRFKIVFITADVFSLVLQGEVILDPHRDTCC